MLIGPLAFFLAGAPEKRAFGQTTSSETMSYQWLRGDTLSGVLFRCGIGQKGSGLRLFGPTGWVARSQGANPNIPDWKKVRIGSTVRLVLPASSDLACLGNSRLETQAPVSPAPLAASKAVPEIFTPPQPPFIPKTIPEVLSPPAPALNPSRTWRLWSGIGLRVTDDGLHTQTDGANFQNRIDAPSLTFDFRSNDAPWGWSAELQYFYASAVSSKVTLPDDYRLGLFSVYEPPTNFAMAYPVLKFGTSGEVFHQISILSAEPRSLAVRRVDAFWLSGTAQVDFDIERRSSFGVTIERTILARLHSSGALASGEMGGWAATVQGKSKIWKKIDFALLLRTLALFGPREFMAKEYVNLTLGFAI